MPGDSFGSLLEWGHVLGRLDDCRRRGTLDDEQEGLLRILRYPHNWRLREATLEAIRDLKTPSEAILHEVRTIAEDESLYYEVRVLAAETLAVWAEGGRHASWTPAARDAVAACVRRLLGEHQPPILHQAAGRVLPALGEPNAEESAGRAPETRTR